LTEDAGGVRDLAVNDWAQIRILNGHWFSPTNLFFGLHVPDKPIFSPRVNRSSLILKSRKPRSLKADWVIL
jgi:hypothetical protein